MSLHTSNAGSHVDMVISATAASALGNGPYTLALLYKRTTDGFPNSHLWMGYQANDFSFRGAAIDDHDLYPTHLGGWYDANLLRDDTTWYWLVFSKGAGTEAVRYHVAAYASTGALTWAHVDGTTPTEQDDTHGTINRITLGDIFGSSFSGDWAALAAFTSELSDAAIEAAFLRSAQDIFDDAPAVLVVAPEASAGSALPDLMGGAGELSRTAGWTASDDPAGFDFAIGTPSTGSAAGTITRVGSATGARASRAAAAGVMLRAGSATGVTPALSPRSGSASGVMVRAGVALGARISRGAAIGLHRRLGSAVGSAPGAVDIKYVPPSFNRPMVVAGLRKAMGFGLPTRPADRVTFYFTERSTPTGPADEDGVPFDPDDRIANERSEGIVKLCAIEYQDRAAKVETFGVVVPARVIVTLIDDDYQQIKDFSHLKAGGDTYWRSSVEPPVALGSIDVWSVICVAEGES